MFHLEFINLIGERLSLLQFTLPFPVARTLRLLVIRDKTLFILSQCMLSFDTSKQKNTNSCIYTVIHSA